MLVMGRPQLAVGTYGRVRVVPRGDGFRALALFRDFDGSAKQIERSGKTRGAAERALAAALRDRTWSGAGTEISADTRVKDVAEHWWAEIQARGLSPGTERLPGSFG